MSLITRAWVATLLRVLLTARIHRERILIPGWGTALLLHVAEPRVAQAVADHSVFLQGSERRLERLYSTADLLLWVLLGKPEQRRHAATRVRRTHDRIHGTLLEEHPGLPLGTAYSAHDPELLLWVHVALHVTVLHTFQALVSPLSPAEQDGYCQEVSESARLLGVPADMIPLDAATLRARFADYLPRLSVGPLARQISHGVLNPPHPRWSEPMLTVSRAWTIGLLPAPVRAAYGIPWSARHEAAFRRSLKVGRALVRILPHRLRHVPPELLADVTLCPTAI